jgi:hypothetical protein
MLFHMAIDHWPQVTCACIQFQNNQYANKINHIGQITESYIHSLCL